MRPAHTIVLAGIKHCGKSTLGKHIARRWELPFVDTDIELEKFFEAETGRPFGTREIYRLLGEEEFRRLEARVMADLAADSAIRIIALGGGVVANPGCPADLLHRLGLRVWLDVQPALAFKRILRRGLPPFLVGAEDPGKEFQRICADRKRLFEQYADLRFVIDRDEPAATVAARLAKEIEKYGTERRAIRTQEGDEGSL